MEKIILCCEYYHIYLYSFFPGDNQTVSSDLTAAQQQDDGFDLATFSITEEEMAELGVSSLPATQSTPPPSYSLIFDNLDFFIRTHHQSLVQENTSIHWIHHIAVEDRVPIYQLSRDKPFQTVMDYDIFKSLPNADTQKNMRLEFIVLGSRILTQYLHAFRTLSDAVVRHIPHRYSTEMSAPSVHVSANLNIYFSTFYFSIEKSQRCLCPCSILLDFCSKMKTKQVT